MNREEEIQAYREYIAQNIKLDWLKSAAEASNDSSESKMVYEIYDVICDMVCYPRESVVIKGTTYPWITVKCQFLKLSYKHVAKVLNRVIDRELHIKNMHPYLVSTLYTQSLVHELETQAEISDDYMKVSRGNPY